MITAAPVPSVLPFLVIKPHGVCVALGLLTSEPRRYHNDEVPSAKTPSPFFLYNAALLRDSVASLSLWSDT